MMPVRLSAPAKINLYLSVTGKRADGYHLLDSLFVFADICDFIEVSPAGSFSLSIKGSFAGKLESDDSNIVLKAAKRLAQKYNMNKGADITLEKNLPVASGIGGGSTDAAATLLALSDLWGLSLSLEELSAVALEIGADVPACLYKKPVNVSGIGEKIEKAPVLPEIAVLLVNPMQEMSTPAVFKARKPVFSAYNPIKTPVNTVKELIKELFLRENDLFDAASYVCPVVLDVLNEISLQKNCLFSRMSGSGATCFGLFENIEDAKAAEDEIRKKRAEWWVSSGKMII